MSVFVHRQPDDNFIYICFLSRISQAYVSVVVHGIKNRTASCKSRDQHQLPHKRQYDDTIEKRISFFIASYKGDQAVREYYDNAII